MIPEIAKRAGRLSFQIGLMAAVCIGVQSSSIASLIDAPFSSNAIISNALPRNALVSHPLTAKSIESEASSALEDPAAREFLTAIVSCALPATKTLKISTQGTTYTYSGDLGLAPDWSTGECDNQCQQWVSACVLARTDYLDEQREISLRGANPALNPRRAELATYTAPEAAFFGNLFKNPQRRYACLAPGQTELPRVCGPSLQSCAISVDPQVTCAEVCKGPSVDGAYKNCRPNDGAQDDSPYVGTVTSFLTPE
jgi:hypothetical protein